MMKYSLNVKIEIEDETIFNDSVKCSYTPKVFTAPNGPEELPWLDKKQRMKNKAICKYCTYRECCLE